MKARPRVAMAGAVLLAAALLGAASAEPARAAAICKTPPQPAFIEVNVAEPEVVFDHALSRPELAKLAKEHGYGHSKGSAVFGLTAGQLKSQLSVHSLLEKRRDGVHCGWPARVIATAGYDGPIAVYVAREHPTGTCQYEAVLGHEMEHVAVFKEALRGYEKRLRKALERALAKGSFPVMGRDRDAVEAEVGKRFEAAFKRAVTEAARERDRRNARLDTPESYRRTRNLCRSW